MCLNGFLDPAGLLLLHTGQGKPKTWEWTGGFFQKICRNGFFMYVLHFGVFNFPLQKERQGDTKTEREKEREGLAPIKETNGEGKGKI